MNIYESIIEDVKAVKAAPDIKGALTRYKDHIAEMRNKAVYTHTEYKKMLEKLQADGYSIDYIKEFEQKERKQYESGLANVIASVIRKMKEELDTLKAVTKVTTGDRAVSTNNLLKLQSILPGMSIEDKETLFECVAERDPNVLEVLYFNVKDEAPAFAERIKEYIDIFTGAAGVALVEKHFNQIISLKNYLDFDMVKSMGDGFAGVDGTTLSIEGTVDRIIEAFIQAIDKDIAQLEEEKSK